jgi:D-3-phosphoglycerate dehydrogenase / 2-oxoglutarate reductase
MNRFKAVLVEHGYSSVRFEREIIESAGGEFIDADSLRLARALELCSDADAVMVRRVVIDETILRSFARCRFLIRYGVGVDNIDLSAATRARIIVGHVPIYCQDEVSTHAVALLLACVRKVLPTHEKIRRGGWDVHRADPIHRLAGRTLGLVGLGTLGQAVARKLSSWNIRLVAHDPYLDESVARALGVRLMALPELLSQSDFISLHVPLLPETTRLIRAETIALMKPRAILINTARGPVVCGESLLRALDSGQIECAALDVFEQEPLPPDSPLRHHPRLLVTDHTAWYSEESQIELQQRAAREVVRICTGGLPEAIANPEVLALLGRTREWQPNHLAVWQSRRAAALALPTHQEKTDAAP